MSIRLLLTTSLIVVFVVPQVGYAQSAEPYNHAAVWRAWDFAARNSYVRGVIDGAINVYIAAAEEWLAPGEFLKTPKLRKVTLVERRVFVGEVESRIPAVITDLYGDPANVYIAMVDMVYLARDKLEGQNIDPLLAAARKRAIELHRLTNR